MHLFKSYLLLLEIFDIAKYAALIEDEKTYREACQMLSDEMHAYVDSKSQQDEIRTKGLEFLPIHIDLMKQILNMMTLAPLYFFALRKVLIWFNNSLGL